MEKLNVTRETIIRTIICAIALVNSLLIIAGHKTINIGDETIEQGVSFLFTLSTTVWGFWKNNSFTKEAIESDSYMHVLKDLRGTENEI